MMRHHLLYSLFGVLLIATLAMAEWRGWSLTRPTEVKNVPRSVRDNPGSYRPAYLYTGSGRYLRGK
ncbi:MAG TPA: hypothetical protein VGJ18_16315 [Gemmatimonadaceae bacterium]|jgi:hypothetical protein